MHKVKMEQCVYIMTYYLRSGSCVRLCLLIYDAYDAYESLDRELIWF
jgi:hypothetical protein